VCLSKPPWWPQLAAHRPILRHASICTLFELTLRGSVHDEVRPLGRCCHLLISLPIGWTKAGAALTGPEAIGQALRSRPAHDACDSWVSIAWQIQQMVCNPLRPISMRFVNCTDSFSSQMVVNGRPRRKVVGQKPPSTAAFEHVEISLLYAFHSIPQAL
jgi:hypothetical protein